MKTWILTGTIIFLVIYAIGAAIYFVRDYKKAKRGEKSVFFTEVKDDKGDKR